MAAERIEFSTELGDEICTLIADGKTFAEICALPNIPCRQTILKWVVQRPEFGDNYARARQTAAHIFEQEVIEIARNVPDDKDAASAARVKLAALTWLAGKRAPKVYGEKLTTEVTGADGAPVQTVVTIKRAVADDENK